MPLAQRQPAGRRGRNRTHLHLLLLFLSVLQTQGHIQIPPDYIYSNLKEAPKITTQPESQTAFSLDDVDLACEATGNPTPSFRWVKDGRQFGEVLLESGSLIAGPDKELRSYQGSYRCYVANELGTAVSDLVHLITESIPTLAKEKKQKRRPFEEGESTVLYCNPPKSSVAPKIHWMDKQLHHIPLNERVTISLDGNLYFANLLVNDSREDYTCNAHYIKASVILPKEPIAMSVTASNSVLKSRRPQLLKPTGTHSSYLVLRGQTLTLECIPEGLPTPDVQWERIDSPLSPSRVRTLNYGRWLQIESVSEADDGEYVCTATNSQGSVKHHYTVTVEAAPYWTKWPEDRLYAPGETVRLHCQADGIPTPNVTWSINGVPLTGTDLDPRRHVTSGTLILTNVEYSDTAIYQCEATNKHGNILVNTHVHVIALPPQILTADGLVYRATTGKTVLLECRTFGSPLPKVDWEILGAGPAHANARMSQMADGNLQISNVSEEDSDMYTCSVRDSNRSISAELEVLNRTKILERPPNLQVVRGNDAVLQCKFTVDHRLKHPTIQWKKDGHKISASSNDDKYTESTDGSLKVTDVQMKDTGIYSCEISTKLDSDSATGSITVQDVPGSPHTLELSEKKNRSVTLSWKPGAENNSPVSEYIIEMKEEHYEAGSSRWEEFKRVPHDIKHLEIHLQPYSTYHFRISAVNGIGRSMPSPPSDSYSTPAAKPDMNPENVTTVSIDPNSMVITWKELERRQFNGPDFKYIIYWRQSPDSDPRWKNSSVSNPPFIVNDTGTFIPFEIKVQATNELGAAAEPVAKIGYSGEDLPLEAPSNVNVKELNKTAVIVRWDPVTPESVRGHLLGYKIHLRKKGPRTHSRRSLAMRSHATDKNRVIEVPKDKAEQVVSDLQFYSNYTLTVAPFNSRGEGPHSKPYHFSTPEGAPGPISSLTFESPSETEVTLHWEAPHNPNGVITGYLLQYQEVVPGSLSPQTESIDLPAVTEFTLKGLDPQRHYLFYLSARNNAGNGEPIKRQGATLLDGEPPSVINVTAGETSVNLSWVPGDRHRNFPFRFRYIEKSDGGEWEESEQINSTQAFYQLQGLNPGIWYRLQIWPGNTSWAFKTNGPELLELPSSFATQGWFIGLISAMILLLLVLIILCYIKKSKGGKYSVKDKEEGQGDTAARTMKEGEFGEYRSLESSDIEKCSIGQPSVCESKRSSNDSLADYGDSVDIQFNEDGSFIGQYSGRRDPRTHTGHDSSGATSPLNPNMPPPSISFPTSVTGILGPN